MVTQTPLDLTHRRVLHIAVPVVLSNATVPILGAVDTAVVGQMGLAAPIGAVGIGAIILSAVYWIFGFLRMGTAGLTAQAIGAGDKDETNALLVRALMIGVAAGFVFIMLQVPIFWGAFQVAPTSPQVESMAREYLGIRIYSAPAAIALYGITGWLIAAGRTREVLVLQFWLNGLNIGLDILFVLKLGWGVAGVASATLIAEWSGLLLGLWMVRGGYLNGYWRNWAQIFEPAKLKRMAIVNGDIMIRSVILQIGFVSFLFLGASFGDVTLAANQVLLQFLYITSYAMDGFATAAEALVGQAMGARTRPALRRAVVMTSQWAAALVVVLALVFGVFGLALIDVMTTSTDVRAVAAQYLPWMIAAPILGGASWMLDGVFIGATRTRDMRNMMIVSFGVYAASLAILMPMFGNHGLWAAMMIFFVMRGVTLAIRYPKLEASV
jgi:MATE family multidrug resistance protein